MTEETTILTKIPEAKIEASEPASNGNGSSAIFGVSLRGWIALILVGTLCFLVTRFHTDKLIDGFMLLAGGAITFYFGQSSKK